MTDRLSYLGLLNTIANAESDAYQYFTAWADVTENPEVEQVVRTVAIREGEHGFAFEKRICELGYSLQRKQGANYVTRMMTLSSPELDDIEKFACLGFRPGEVREDRFGTFMDDRTMDTQTSQLMGRFIGEERDSVRLLCDCLNALARERGSVVARKATDAGADVSLEDVCAEIKELKTSIAGLHEAIAAITDSTPKKRAGKKSAARN